MTHSDVTATYDGKMNLIHILFTLYERYTKGSSLPDGATSKSAANIRKFRTGVFLHEKAVPSASKARADA